MITTIIIVIIIIIIIIIVVMSSGVHRHSDKYALRKIPRAQCAFKVLMIHEV